MDRNDSSFGGNSNGIFGGQTVNRFVEEELRENPWQKTEANTVTVSAAGLGGATVQAAGNGAFYNEANTARAKTEDLGLWPEAADGYGESMGVNARPNEIISSAGDASEILEKIESEVEAGELSKKAEKALIGTLTTEGAGVVLGKEKRISESATREIKEIERVANPHERMNKFIDARGRMMQEWFNRRIGVDNNAA